MSGLKSRGALNCLDATRYLSNERRALCVRATPNVIITFFLPIVNI